MVEGEYTKISDNSTDDRAPYYDPASDTIVWHRMLNERFQIVSYDLADGTEEVLTNSATNNMEPTRLGDVTVWQRWVKNNWEIFMHDGEELSQLTDNEVHDVAPQMREGHVMWQQLGANNEKMVTIYEIATGHTNTITNNDGGAIVNPRLVLMYDTTFENGDVLTQGYDLETGDVIPLGAASVPTPEDIPETDTTGETRALIQQKSPGRDELSESLTDITATSTGSTTPETVTGTTTSASSTAVSRDEATLDISSSTLANNGFVELLATREEEQRTVEVVARRASTTDAIPDVVIPPQASTTEESAG